MRSGYCVQLVDTTRIFTPQDRNYVIWVESRQFMTLDLVSKAFNLLREHPLERGCMSDTEYLFNTPLPLRVQIRREKYVWSTGG